MKQLIAFKKLVLLTTFCLYYLLPIKAQNTLEEPLNKKEESVRLDYNSKIKGEWWSIDDTVLISNALFSIDDSTIFYPDTQPPDYKYRIQHDSLIIFYDGFISKSKITKATGDTLELTSDGDKQVFIKSLR